jgi:hypothetical protein
LLVLAAEELVAKVFPFWHSWHGHPTPADGDALRRARKLKSSVSEVKLVDVVLTPILTRLELSGPGCLSIVARSAGVRIQHPACRG